MRNTQTLSSSDTEMKMCKLTFMCVGVDPHLRFMQYISHINAYLVGTPTVVKETVFVESTFYYNDDVVTSAPTPRTFVLTTCLMRFHQPTKWDF